MLTLNTQIEANNPMANKIGVKLKILIKKEEIGMENKVPLGTKYLLEVLTIISLMKISRNILNNSVVLKRPRLSGIGI